MVLFSFLVFLFLIAGLFTILTNNPVHSILGLILIFFFSAFFLILLGLEFFAILILIIYIGAIAVLFLFIVMLLNIRVLEINVGFVKYWWFAVVYSLFFLFNIYCASINYFTGFLQNNDFYNLNFANYYYGNSLILEIAEILFFYYPHLVFLVLLILFLAIVSPIVLTVLKFDSSANSFFVQKQQNIFSQTVRNFADYL